MAHWWDITRKQDQRTGICEFPPLDTLLSPPWWYPIMTDVVMTFLTDVSDVSFGKSNFK